MVHYWNMLVSKMRGRLLVGSALLVLAWLSESLVDEIQFGSIRPFCHGVVFLGMRVGGPWLVATGPALFGHWLGHAEVTGTPFGSDMEHMAADLLEVLFIAWMGARMRGLSLRALDAMFWCLALVPAAWTGAQAGDVFEGLFTLMHAFLVSQMGIGLSALLAAHLPAPLVRKRLIRRVNVITSEYVASWVSLIWLLTLVLPMEFFHVGFGPNNEALMSMTGDSSRSIIALRLSSLEARYTEQLKTLAQAHDVARLVGEGRGVSTPGFTRVVSVEDNEAPPPTHDLWVSVPLPANPHRLLLGEVSLALIRTQLGNVDPALHWYLIRRAAARLCVPPFGATDCPGVDNLHTGRDGFPPWTSLLHAWAYRDTSESQVQYQRAEYVSLLLVWLLSFFPGYFASRRVTPALSRALASLAKVSGGPAVPISSPNLLMLAPRIIARYVTRQAFLTKRNQEQIHKMVQEQQALLEAAQVVLLRCELTQDDQYTVVQVSESITSLFGWRPDEVRSAAWFFSKLHPDDSIDLTEAAREARSFGKAKTRQFRFSCKDGSYRLVQADLSFQEWRKDGGWRAVGTWVDITDYAQAIKRAETNERLLSLATLAAGVAHELKQPLNVIAMAVGNARRSLTRDMPDVRDHVNEKLQRISEQVKRASAIIDEIRPAQTGLARLSLRARLDAHDALRSAVSHFDDQVIAWDILIEISTAHRPVLVEVDQRALSQVIIALISNAHDAIVTARCQRLVPRRDVIHVSLDDSTVGEVSISVRDSGLGFNQQLTSRLFEPFYSTKGEGEGRGLGLYIAANLVREMNGSISAESSVNGARFTVRLPTANTGANTAQAD